MNKVVVQTTSNKVIVQNSPTTVIITSQGVQGAAGGGGGGGLNAPQVASPSAGDVTAGFMDITLPDSKVVVIAALNGQVLDDARWSQVTTTLTVTPEFGFNSTADIVVVYQNA